MAVHTMPDAIPAIDDAEQLSWPDDQQLLIRRITELSTQRLITAWMLVEIAAIAALLDEGAITAGRVWQLVLSHYEIVSSASSSSDLSDDPSWTQPLTDRALVWKHLTALCAGEGAAPVQTMPGP